MVYGMFPLELHGISPCRVEAEFPPKPAPAAPEAESPRVKPSCAVPGHRSLVPKRVDARGSATRIVLR